MPTASRPRRKCTKCGSSFHGKSELCEKCVTSATTVASESSRKIADVVRERFAQRKPHDGPICPFCKLELDWENIGTSETEATIYVREKIYYCPGCRAFLGVSSWHSEG